MYNKTNFFEELVVLRHKLLTPEEVDRVQEINLHTGAMQQGRSVNPGSSDPICTCSGKDMPTAFTLLLLVDCCYSTSPVS